MTRFTELVGCSAPVQLAGLGSGVGTPELARAVARAGGLGLLGHRFDPVDLAAGLDLLTDPGPGQVGVNFLVPFLDPALVDLCAARVRVVDFFYGSPQPSLVARAHRGGALASWQVGDAEEARAAVAAGCDFVVAQGVEAGGHVRARAPLAQVLDDVLAAVSVPVLAAGGIATAAAVSDAIAGGADGVRVGTRFVTADESGAHPAYVKALLQAADDDTQLTTVFDAGWPDAPHRVLRSCIAAAAAHHDDVTGTMGTGPTRRPIERWSPVPPDRTTEGSIGAMALYAGTAVAEVHSRQPARAIVDDLVALVR